MPPPLQFQISPSPQPPPKPYATPPLTVILTIVLLVFFFLGFFTLYFCKCFLDTITQAWRIHHGGIIINSTANTAPTTTNNNNPPINLGLDPRIIQSFPTFLYSSVKDLRSEKYGLECAICLLEFDDDHTLRLLTVCYHVFHQECIDLWFEFHRTCPVCRRDLNPPNVDEFIIECTEISDDDNNIIGNQRTNSIDVWSSSGRSNERMKREQNLPEKFSRSHSTGHSIVRDKPEEEDKYTLRLPEHVKIKITRGHNQTESCVTFAEVVKTRGYDHRRFGEVSGQTQLEN